MKRLLILYVLLAFSLATLAFSIIYSRQKSVIKIPPVSNISLNNNLNLIDSSSPSIVDIAPLQANEPAEIPATSEPSPTETSESNFLSYKQKQVAEKLTSLFENGTTEMQYCYTEKLGDGRGITAGRAGFTTRDGDAYEVIKKYSQSRPNNKLAKYLETLKNLNEKGSDSTKGLDGYEKAWRDSCEDELFIKAQDYVVDILYFIPSQKYADTHGLKLAISRAFLYDTIIQHGDGDDKDSIKSIIKATNNNMGGSPKNGINEENWINEFMSVRRSKLARASDSSTRKEWAESVGRVDVYLQILKAKNYDLITPIELHTNEYDEKIM